MEYKLDEKWIALDDQGNVYQVHVSDKLITTSFAFGRQRKVMMKNECVANFMPLIYNDNGFQLMEIEKLLKLKKFYEMVDLNKITNE